MGREVKRAIAPLPDRIVSVSRTAAPTVVPAAPRERGRELWFPMRSLSHALVLAALVIAALIAFSFVRLGGWTYYQTPLRVRGYLPVHRILRPSGRVGELFGIGGFAVMLLTLLYVIRKKLGGKSRLGSMKVWLEFHIFCGVVGPALITLHTSFKFNGVISVAYWAMVLVVLSGFVGRYLFVRIPKTIRGTELSLSEIEERAAELREALAGTGLPAQPLGKIHGFEQASAGRRLRWRRLRRELRQAGVDRDLVENAIALVRERDALLRRIANLSRTKKLFEMWHVFHRPLVYLMLAIAALHIGLAIYFGYSVPGR